MMMIYLLVSKKNMLHYHQLKWSDICAFHSVEVGHGGRKPEEQFTIFTARCWKVYWAVKQERRQPDWNHTGDENPLISSL